VLWNWVIVFGFAEEGCRGGRDLVCDGIEVGTGARTAIQQIAERVGLEVLRERWRALM
jgi:hypothetical protein